MHGTGQVRGVLVAGLCGVFALDPGFGPAGPACAATNQVSTLNAGGGWTTGTAYRCVSSIGTGIATPPIAGGAHILHAGMLNAFLHRPDLDRDADGRADEDDPDDDGDSLRDGDEITGACFSPATPTDPQAADSDGDGANDGTEAGTGTDPLDPTANLAFLSVSAGTGGLVVRWRARAYRAYRLFAAPDLTSLETAPARTNQIVAGSGTGTWEVAEAGWTNPVPVVPEFYRLDVP